MLRLILWENPIQFLGYIKIMTISNTTTLRWMPYLPLFVITVGLNIFLFLIFIVFTSCFLWLIIPSSLAHSIIILISLGLYFFLFFIARSKGSRRLMVISLGGTVVPCLMLIFTLVSPFIETDESSHQKPNKRQPLTSPSGKYVLTVPIERSKVDRGPLGFGEHYWYVTILDTNGNIVYRDIEEDFPGRFGTYWIWDEKDRVWIFASDEGIFYYECINDIWTRHYWGESSNDDIAPPGISVPKFFKTGYIGRIRFMKQTKTSCFK